MTLRKIDGAADDPLEWFYSHRCCHGYRFEVHAASLGAISARILHSRATYPSSTSKAPGTTYKT